MSKLFVFKTFPTIDDDVNYHIPNFFLSYTEKILYCLGNEYQPNSYKSYF